MVDITLIAAFLAGIVSFLSPCVLPLLPGFLAYLAGTTVDEESRSGKARWRVFFNSVAFVLGFSVVFALLGVLLNSLLSTVSYSIQAWLSRIAGVIIIAFGLSLVGLIRIGFLQQDHKLVVKRKFSISYVTSFVFGAAFAVGWTPCVGAVLGSILVLAASHPGMSFGLLMAYALGLGIPFLFVGWFSTELLAFIRKSQWFFKYFNIIIGILLIILGILVFTQTTSLVANVGLLNNWLLS